MPAPEIALDLDLGIGMERVFVQIGFFGLYCFLIEEW